MELLRHDLWVHGWRILRAWMKDGTITVMRCAVRQLPVQQG
ncbi:hypothetical protein ACFC08_34400 [Streptomyces sp. NPDC056112]|nr:hypothetical protein [Streptomyces sp. HYC2]